MALIDLLTNPGSYNITYGGPSKGITYNAPKYHLQRVEWDVSDKNADPTFVFGNDHNNGPVPDFLFRGGFLTNLNRRGLDIRRMTNFLFSNRGIHFIGRQVALQALNPQKNEKVFNLGVNMLTQIGLSGLSNVKRSGLVPFEDQLGIDVLGGLKDQLGIPSGNGYLGEIGENIRDINYSLGDPGKRSAREGLEKIIDNPFKKKVPYNVKIDYSKIDVVNFYSIFTNNPENKLSLKDESLTGFSMIEDFIKFRFEILNSNDPTVSHVIAFRAFLTAFNDSYNASHNEVNFNGRGETFYTYNKFKRQISISFQIAAQSRHEMRPLYQKLNYLVAQTAPNYSDIGRIRTPYLKVTVGDYLAKVPGILNSANLTWQKTYPWEIKLDPDDKDKDMKQLPHILDVSLNFIPIHDFIPNNRMDTPFIGIGPDENNENNWLPQPTIQEEPQPINTPPPISIDNSPVTINTEGMRAPLNTGAVDPSSVTGTVDVGKVEMTAFGDLPTNSFGVPPVQ